MAGLKQKMAAAGCQHIPYIIPHTCPVYAITAGISASLRSCKRHCYRRRSGGFMPSLAMTITVSPEDPRSPEAQKLLNAFVEEVRHRYESAPADVGYFDPVLV